MAHNSRKAKYVMNFIGDLWEEAIEKPGQNIISARNHFSYMELPSVRPSTNLIEAQLKARRLYKRICRYVNSLDAFCIKSSLDDSACIRSKSQR